MLPKFLWRYQWARRRHGGKWERWGSEWVPVQDWSSPADRPDEYGAGELPQREEWSSW